MLKSLIKPTKTKRLFFFLFGDIFLICLSLFLSFLIRFEFILPQNFMRLYLGWLPMILVIKVAVLGSFGLYNFTWMFVGIKELFAIGNACLLSSSIIFILDQISMQTKIFDIIPRSILLIDLILTLLFVGNFRVAKRLYQEAWRASSHGKPLLIVGAGPTGERLVREFLRSHDHTYNPVGLVDDDPTKIGTNIHGIRVYGRIEDIPAVIEKTGAESAIIAITTAKHVMIRKYFDLLNEAGIKDIKVVPHIDQLPTNSLSVKDIHDIKIEDLLYRDAVKIDQESIRQFLQSKTILVTGAAGSIGSEIVRQTLKYHPAKIVVFDIDETEVFNLMLNVKHLARMTTQVVPFIGDVRRERSLENAFTTHKPQIVFHAAAYKHVPMMEIFPEEALETNSFGTYLLASIAIRHGVKQFVNISTDKAVNPTSMMGATKRLAELFCTSFNRLNGTRFMSVRFGNVLGSRGSVVPIFFDQIRKGGPVTVTHPKVERYFMTIPEAVSLVFQAASMGSGGEVFILDMGKPVQIVRIAEDLIRLNGMEPYSDIKIEFVGLRPGEKMFEEILTAEEGTNATSHEKIYIAKNTNQFEPEELEEVIHKLQSVLQCTNGEIKAFLCQYVPFYEKSE